MKTTILAVALFAAVVLPVAADEKADYNRRAAQADLAAYRALDLDGDGRLTLEEVRSDLSFGPRFNDVDINRDGVITPDEMRRYLEQTYGVQF